MRALRRKQATGQIITWELKPKTKTCPIFQVLTCLSPAEEILPFLFLISETDLLPPDHKFSPAAWQIRSLKDNYFMFLSDLIFKKTFSLRELFLVVRWEDVPRHVGLSPGVRLWHHTKQIFLPNSHYHMTCPGYQANPRCQIPGSGNNSDSKTCISSSHDAMLSISWTCILCKNTLIYGDTIIKRNAPPDAWCPFTPFLFGMIPTPSSSK